MNIVIAMAGHGSRFKSAGFSVPKHEIQVRGRSLFEWSLSSLSNFFNEKFYFVGRSGNFDCQNLQAICTKLGLQSANFIELPESTKGQAHTVSRALESVAAPNDPLIIYNIDTYVEPEFIRCADIKGEGWLPVFKAPGDKWSFCVVTPEGRVTEVAEKNRISGLATIGLYYFKSGDLFAQCYGSYDYSQYSEQFVAPLYNELLNNPQNKIFATTVPSSAVHVLGTPEDLKQFAPEFEFP